MVELGVRMVPLVLGTKYKALLQVLRKHCIDADRLTFDGSNHLPVPEPGTRPFFSQTSRRSASGQRKFQSLLSGFDRNGKHRAD